MFFLDLNHNFFLGGGVWFLRSQTWEQGPPPGMCQYLVLKTIQKIGKWSNCPKIVTCSLFTRVVDQCFIVEHFVEINCP